MTVSKDRAWIRRHPPIAAMHVERPRATEGLGLGMAPSRLVLVHAIKKLVRRRLCLPRGSHPPARLRAARNLPVELSDHPVIRRAVDTMARHIVLTSHPRPDTGTAPFTVDWDAPDARLRGPILAGPANRGIRNVIGGTHGLLCDLSRPDGGCARCPACRGLATAWRGSAANAYHGATHGRRHVGRGPARSPLAHAVMGSRRSISQVMARSFDSSGGLLCIRTSMS